MTRRKFLEYLGVASLVPLVKIPAAQTKNEFPKKLKRLFASQKEGGSIMQKEPIPVGNQKQLFVDELFFASKRDVRLVVHRPRRTNEKCVIADKLWESHRVCAYNTVMEEDGLVKLWYDAIASDGSRWLCYATSKDGMHFEKPDLDIVSFDEYKQTNILFPPTRAFHEPSCVFKDTNPNCPSEERYKMVCSYHPEGKEGGTWVFASPDGLHFKALSDRPSFRPSDTGNVCFFDERIGKYVAYVRLWAPWRKVGRCEFDDITNWGKETEVFSYDEEDWKGLDKIIFTEMDFYNSAALKYPQAQDIYLMFPTAYYHYRKEIALKLGTPPSHAGNDGPMDIQFATSRDGVQWTRLDRQPFIPLGKTGDWDGGYAYMAVGCVCRQDEVWLYYAVADMTHGNYDFKRDKFKGTITRAVLRLDGFVSVKADYAGGEFTTPPLLFSGKQLEVNVDTSAGGHLRVELQDEQGNPIEGFSASDCNVINGNFIRKTVTWQGKNDLSQLVNKPIHLRFLLRSANLFAFQFI